MPFMDYLNLAMNSAKDMVAKYGPAVLSPEKRFGKACVTACALVTMADGEAEDSELDMSADFMAGIPEITEYLGAEEANEIFAMQISALQENYAKNKAMFTMEVNRMLAEMKTGVESAEWKGSVNAIAEAMGSSNGNGTAGDDEVAMIAKISTAMG